MPHMSDSLVNSGLDLIVRNLRDTSGQLVEVILILAKQTFAFLAGGSFLENMRWTYCEALIVSQRPAHETLDREPLIRGQIFNLMNHEKLRALLGLPIILGYRNYASPSCLPGRSRPSANAIPMAYGHRTPPTTEKKLIIDNPLNLLQALPSHVQSSGTQRPSSVIFESHSLVIHALPDPPG